MRIKDFPFSKVGNERVAVVFPQMPVGSLLYARHWVQYRSYPHVSNCPVDHLYHQIVSIDVYTPHTHTIQNIMCFPPIQNSVT